MIRTDDILSYAEAPSYYQNLVDESLVRVRAAGLVVQRGTVISQIELILNDYSGRLCQGSDGECDALWLEFATEGELALFLLRWT